MRVSRATAALLAAIAVAAFARTAGAGGIPTPPGAGLHPQAAAQRGAAKPAPPNYEAADVEGRVAAALKGAREENRRVLVAWGGRDDQASQAFLERVLRDRDVSRTLLYEYEVVRVDAGPQARALAAKYGADLQKAGLPSLTVLDASGAVLANQAAAAFRQAEVFDAKAALAFLVKHQAPYLNADTVFNEALSRAKKEQKTLFVWFSAPW